MSLYTLTFSPTGGTRKVVDLLTDAFGPAGKIDLSRQNETYSACTFSQNDLCFIAVPSFGGRVPAVVCDHLKEMKADHTPAILVVTYGNRAYDDALLELQEVATSSGFHVIAAVSAVTEHSIMHQYATGRPDAEDMAELRAFSQQLKNAVDNRSFPENLKLPGNKPFRAYNGVPLKPKAGKACTSCGSCAKLCPVGAIPTDNPSQTLADTCITCMRCVAICPEKARSLNPLMLFVAGRKLKKACAERKPNECFMEAL